MVETKIYSHISTTTAITVASSVSTRIYPMILPQDCTYPALTYTRIGGGRVNDISGYSCLDNPVISIETWATSYSIAKTLSTKVHSAMNQATAFKSLLISDVDDFNEDLRIYRIVQDYSCWDRG